MILKDFIWVNIGVDIVILINIVIVVLMQL